MTTEQAILTAARAQLIAWWLDRRLTTDAPPSPALFQEAREMAHRVLVAAAPAATPLEYL